MQWPRLPLGRGLTACSVNHFLGLNCTLVIIKWFWCKSIFLWTDLLGKRKGANSKETQTLACWRTSSSLDMLHHRLEWAHASTCHSQYKQIEGIAYMHLALHTISIGMLLWDWRSKPHWSIKAAHDARAAAQLLQSKWIRSTDLILHLLCSQARAVLNILIGWQPVGRSHWTAAPQVHDTPRHSSSSFRRFQSCWEGAVRCNQWDQSGPECLLDIHANK